jgi:hypothetical protein
MIFPILEIESQLRVNDKSRLDATKSFLSPDEASITLVEIEPEVGAGFIDVTNNLYLDWLYTTDGIKTISLRITTDALPTIITKDIEVLLEENDIVFSSDDDLLAHEDDILRYVRSGRSSYLDKHRLAKKRIVRWLSEQRIYDVDGNNLTDAAIMDVDEVNEWSKFYVLYLIFNSLSNAIDDIFAQKAVLYQGLAKDAQKRSALRLDLNGDGVEDINKDARTYRLIRR